ncbi:MAG: FKBP-type peptidyl-prolyl cis-trans isomerase [Bacteroidetes bacterium]|nr:MAG: FKBP-type peptidyl-prolyl cis-trans isomerase [Bacteroidota bacterium]
MIKFNVLYKINDSVLYDSHGKMPQFFGVSPQDANSYSPFELFTMLRKGDSVVTTQSVDTLFKKGMQQQIPFAKKGDQIKTYIKILEVFRVDSIARKDYEAEMAKDKPRQEKESQEAQAKQKEKEEKEMQAYFSANKITPVRAPKGTYVLIKEKGNGEPAAVGKFVTVKYSGKGLINNQQFDAGVYVFQVGPGNAIQGWHDGIPLFNKGGKGTLFVPGTLAYGQDGPAGPFATLVFDVDILNVSDTQEKADADKKIMDSLAAKNLPKAN